MGIPALILAGGVASDEFAAAYGTRVRALVPLVDQPMLVYVLQALRQAPSIGQIVVAVPSGAGEMVSPLLGNGESWTAGGQDMVETCDLGFACWDDSEWGFVITADLPLVTADTIEGFLQECAQWPERSAFLPVIAKATYERKFPGFRRTWIRFREGPYSAGNASYFQRRRWPPVRETLREVNRRRKKPLQIAAFIGYATLFKLAVGLMPLDEVESLCGRDIPGELKLVNTAWPELGADVDHVSDVLLAETILRARQEPSAPDDQ